MANTEFATGANLTQKLWAKKLFHETIADAWISKFIGSDSNSLIVRKDETSKDAGDRVRIGLRVKLSGAGVAGDDTMEGQEESMTFYNDDLLVDQLRNAVRLDGKMTEQRVAFKLRTEARMALKDWWTERMDTAFFNQMAGNTAQTNLVYTGSNSTIAPSASTFFGAGLASGSAETSVSATTANYFTLTDIDRAVNLAKTVSPLMRPLRIDGDEMYALFLHPNQVRLLRTSTSTGQWLDIQKSAMQGGSRSNNPIFTGALGVYNGVVIHEALRIPNAVTANTSAADQTPYRRAVFCGAQAAGIAFGQDYSSGNDQMWNEDVFDYANQFGVSAGMIWGLKKMVFNSRDFATITITSYAPAP